MKDAYEDIVCDAVARHLAVSPENIHPAHDVLFDLGLDALDVALIALRFEALGRLEFPLARLDDVQTVRQLTNLVRDWALSGATGEDSLCSSAAE